MNSDGSLAATAVRVAAGRAALVVALVGAALLGVALAVAGATAPAVATTPCPVEVSTVAPIDRVAGEDRYATAACAAAAAFPDGSEEVVLARGDAAGGLADALAGALLATARDAPVLLTAPEALPPATVAALESLGADRVTVLGGEAAVAPEVAADLEALVAETVRIGGADRAGTAAAVAAEAATADRAFVVNGHRPADSLVAAAPAAREGSPLLLVTRDGIPAATRAALAGVAEVVIVGGHGVVGEEVAAALRAEFGDAAVRRVAGRDRGETAASVARAFPTDGRLHLAAGADERLVDAVTAGWAAAREGGGPVLLTGHDALQRPAERWLRLGGLVVGEDLAPARLVGGPEAIAETVVAELEGYYDEARAGGPAAEVRGVWVHLFDDALKSREGIHRLLDEVARAGANTVVAQVVRRQDAYYDSAVLPRTPDPALPGDLDVIDELTAAAHDRGLEVHAWYSVLQGYHSYYDDLELPAGHVWREHGPEADDTWATTDKDGETLTYLDPGHPGVHDHVAAVMAEIAADYDVDAVHLDYVRYPGAATEHGEDGQWGYNPTSLARFRERTGLTDTPDPLDGTWAAWRRAQTRQLARRLYAEVAHAAPDVDVSIAASTMGEGPDADGNYRHTRTFRDVFQDWPRWLDEGAVDAAFPMNYFREHNATERTWFDQWVAFESDLTQHGTVAVGQGAYLNSRSGSLAQLARARAATDGVVLYSYQQAAATGAPRALFDDLAGGLFADPAPPPPSPRDRARGHVLVEAGDGELVQLRGAGSPPPGERGDAAGHAAFLHLAPGEWTVTTPEAPEIADVTVEVAAGEVTRVELAPGS